MLIAFEPRLVFRFILPANVIMSSVQLPTSYAFPTLSPRKDRARLSRASTERELRSTVPTADTDFRYDCR